MLLEMKLHACVWVFAGWVDGQVRLPQGGIVWELDLDVFVAEGGDLADSRKEVNYLGTGSASSGLELHLTYH